MDSLELEFKPINVERDGQTCLRFREDSFVCSFGNADKFFEADGHGPQRYLKWLSKLLTVNPFYGVHVWEKSAIIGQIEGSRLEQKWAVRCFGLASVRKTFER